MNVDINFPIIDVILRSVNDKDFVVLGRTTIHLYNNNVVLESNNDLHSFSYLMDKYQRYDKNGIVQNHRNKCIHLLSQEFIIVLYSPIIERIEMLDNKLKINIIADYIEHFIEPNVYIRKVKLEKLKERIRRKEKKTE